MCGRYASFTPPEAMQRLAKTVNPSPNFAPTWNLAPSQSGLVVRRHPESGERHLDVLRWGFVPHWTKDLKAARKPINARAATIATSGMFRAAAAARRCLVPADAFYEWYRGAGGKQPFAFARQDGAPLMLAGLWDGWRGPGGEIVRTYAIITCPANALMAQVHDRMPVILEPETWPVWLGERAGDPLGLLRPAGPAVLGMSIVSTAVNSVANDGPHLLENDIPLTG